MEEVVRDGHLDSREEPQCLDRGCNLLMGSDGSGAERRGCRGGRLEPVGRGGDDVDREPGRRGREEGSVQLGRFAGRVIRSYPVQGRWRRDALVRLWHSPHPHRKTCGGSATNLSKRCLGISALATVTCIYVRLTDTLRLNSPMPFFLLRN